MPAPIQGLRTRVERMLRGDFRIDDLSKLFLYARDRGEGQESVKEIGDFVAHHDERNRGIINQRARDFSTFVSVRFPRSGPPFDHARLPANFPVFLGAAERRMKDSTVKRELGMRLKDVVRLLPSIKQKIKANPDRTLYFSSLDSVEHAIVQYLTNMVVIDACFSGDRLFKDFHAVLQKRAILRASEAKQFEVLRPLVILFAVCVMHNSVIILDDGSEADLSFHVRDGMVSVSVRGPPQNGIRLAFEIFTTQLAAKDYCEPALLVDRAAVGHELEITPRRLLGILS